MKNKILLTLIIFLLLFGCKSQQQLHGVTQVTGLEHMISGEKLSFEIEGVTTEIIKLDKPGTAYVRHELSKGELSTGKEKGTLINVEIEKTKIKDKSQVNSHNKDKSETNTGSKNKEKSGGAGLWPYLIAIIAGLLTSKLLRIYIPFLNRII